MGIIEQVKQMKLEEARKEARKEGAEENRRFMVANLLTSTSFTVAKIATLAGVTEAYVNRLKASMAK